MSENPFQSPETSAASLSSETLGLDWFDGECIVVPDKTALPQRCIVTNEAVASEQYSMQTLVYAPTWVLIVLLVYLVVRKICRVKFGLSKPVRAKYTKRKVVASLLLVASLVVVPFVAIFDSTFLIILTLAIMFISIGFLVMGPKPLRIVKREKDRFWIKGCSVEFMNSLMADPEAGRA